MRLHIFPVLTPGSSEIAFHLNSWPTGIPKSSNATTNDCYAINNVPDISRSVAISYSPYISSSLQKAQSYQNL
eukprot:4793474-Amphidinium_carterae.1